MKTRYWLIIAALLGLGLVIALVPAVLAQGPLNNDGTGFGNGSLADTPGFGRGWMMNGVRVPGMGHGQSAMLRQGQMMIGPGYGYGFVDEDGDGICDNCGDGRGGGTRFVDENGDGVCDYAGIGMGQGRGRMLGHQTQ